MRKTVNVEIWKEIEIFLFGILISYLILASNNFVWNSRNIAGYEYCPGDEPCIRGLYGIFYSVAIDYRDRITILWGGVMIWILVYIFDLRKHFKLRLFRKISF